jgi:hypothetical protein
MRLILSFMLILMLVLVIPAQAPSESIRPIGGEELIGTYYWAFSFGQAFLKLEADGKADYRWADCTSGHLGRGTYSIDNGIVAMTHNPSTEKLTSPLVIEEPDLAADQEANPPKDVTKKTENQTERLVPVRWGPRLYLIYADGIVEFCNAVNAGVEPRHGKGVGDNDLGVIYLRLGDEEKPATGFPELSKKWQKYLLVEPLRVKVINLQTNSEGRGTATIDIGSEDGLQVGMRFSPPKSYRYIGFSFMDTFRVMAVSARNAEISVYGDLKIGDTISTKYEPSY